MEATDNKWLGLAIIALLTIGAGIGRCSVEPEVITKTDTVTETVVETETVKVDHPYIPQACLDAIAYAETYAEAAGRMTSTGPTIKDTINKARKAAIAEDFANMTEAQNRLSELESQTLNDYMIVQEVMDRYEEASTECKEQAND